MGGEEKVKRKGEEGIKERWRSGEAKAEVEAVFNSIRLKQVLLATG